MGRDGVGVGDGITVSDKLQWFFIWANAFGRKKEECCVAPKIAW